MEIIIANSKKEKKDFLNFYISQYHNHKLRRDSLSGLLKRILFETSVMSKSIKMLPLLIKKDDEVIMCCVLAKALRMQEYLQMSFFESKEHSLEGFKLLYDKAEEIAEKWQTRFICASLNIHVNYGLGFLKDSYLEPQSFGMAHNDEFIHEYFEKYGFSAIDMVTFHKNMEDEFTLLNDRLRGKLKTRYSVRKADFKNIEKEVEIYTKINNDAFENHPFYYKKIEKEELDFFKDFKLLLKPENLLFVLKDDIEVGFMLWYPDFHQLMGEKETVGLKTVINNKIFNRKMDKFKIVEMGVIKAEQKNGAILALFDYCFMLTKGRYKSFESGWILKDNMMSGSFGYKWADGICKNYVAYVKEL